LELIYNFYILKKVNQKLTILNNPKGIKMKKKELDTESTKIKDLATEAAIQALVPEEDLPCKSDDKNCTKRWFETQSDCA
jgi:hypothetical protein